MAESNSDTASLPDDATADAFVLRNARHPLLERTLKPKGVAVVPLTVEIDSQHRQVIISGPNTGGKTVALKTIGLMALMAQSGIPVPAERAELPIFDGVFADIGDYQSIEQNLSTFSAHVTNIDFISHHATRDSLVLLDELGSATDPEEGAALAVSIADFFRRAGCLSIVSTHHTALKVYAANTEGVLNAAVGFDERTLAPTYELRIGVPGASAGINIAQQLGLNPQIVAEAREKLTYADPRRLALSRSPALAIARARRGTSGAARRASRNLRASAITWRWKARRSSARRSARWRRSWRACCTTSNTRRARR